MLSKVTAPPAKKIKTEKDLIVEPHPLVSDAPETPNVPKPAIDVPFFKRRSRKSYHPTPLPQVARLARRKPVEQSMHGIRKSTTTPMRIFFKPEEILSVPEQQRDKVVLIMVTHCLGTEAGWLDEVKKMGILPENIFMMGKYYSTHAETLENIQKMGIKARNSRHSRRLGYFAETFDEDLSAFLKDVEETLQKRYQDTGFVPFKFILRDDGGKLLTHEMLRDEYFSQFPLYGNEQTQKGVWEIEGTDGKPGKGTPCDYWVLPDTEYKTNVEPKYIAEAAVEKVAGFISDVKTAKKPVCGICGLGHIGEAMAKKLLDMGFEVMFYDTNANIEADPRLTRVTREEMLEKCNYVFGCSGHDVFTGMKLSDIKNKDLHLVSCSSEDIEFRTFLRDLDARGVPAPENMLSDLKYTTENDSNLTFHLCGFPVNFGGTKHSVEPKKIAGTRKAQMGSFYQALIANPKKHSVNKGQHMRYKKKLAQEILNQHLTEVNAL